jgi:hypothetical protein
MFFEMICRIISKRQIPYRGQLKLWAASHDVNFYCDFLKFFLEMEECSGLAWIWFSFSLDFKKKCYATLSIFFSHLGNYKFLKINF